MDIGKYEFPHDQGKNRLRRACVRFLYPIRAPFRFRNAFSNSGGITSVCSILSAASHCPSSWAAATFASPASVIRPAWISRSTRRMLLIDQALPARRGLNRSEYLELSRRLFLTSTQPKQSASSCASWSERYALRGPFL